MSMNEGGNKLDDGKPRYDLMDPYALEMMSMVLKHGAERPEYGPHNWRKGLKVSRLLRAGIGHLLAIVRGEDNDKETGLPHAAHAMCCVMFILWTMKNRPDLDDRWKPEPEPLGILSGGSGGGGCIGRNSLTDGGR